MVRGMKRRHPALVETTRARHPPRRRGALYCSHTFFRMLSVAVCHMRRHAVGADPDAFLPE